jgi:predicted transposase/invertase (TIGR01784 family)
MVSVIHQPADKLFKLSMGEIGVAKEFFETYLPSHLQEKINLNSLKLEKQTFIDEAYKATEADIVYSVKLGQETAYLYLLSEHQSSVDHWLSFRLLVYSVRLMELHRKQNPAKPLPVIYSMVIYTGKELWNAPLDIFPLFGDSESLARDIFLKPYQLLDLNQISDESLQQQALSGLVAFTLKYRQSLDFKCFLEKLMPWIHQIEIHYERGEFLSRTVLNYVVNGIDTNEKELLIQKAEEFLSPKLRGEMMTIAEQWREEGIQKGIQKGEATLLIKLLERRFNTIPSSYMDSIHQADANILLTWGERVLEAKSLEDIFK